MLVVWMGAWESRQISSTISSMEPESARLPPDWSMEDGDVNGLRPPDRQRGWPGTRR